MTDGPAGASAAGPGTYVLVLRLPERTRLGVGRLGRFRLESGHYLYVGSAQGSGGVAARVGRHLAGTGRPHWHVDHLRAVARPVAVWWAPGKRREHAFAAALGRVLEAPVSGFGSSDCRCPSHLFFSPEMPSPELLPDAVRIVQPDGGGQFTCTQGFPS